MGRDTESGDDSLAELCWVCEESNEGPGTSTFVSKS